MAHSGNGIIQIMDKLRERNINIIHIHHLRVNVSNKCNE
jgi:hypothetical protein